MCRSPLFVTLKKKDQQGAVAMRGCIGTLGPIQLHEGLWTYARARWGSVCCHADACIVLSLTMGCLQCISGSQVRGPSNKRATSFTCSPHQSHPQLLTACYLIDIYWSRFMFAVHCIAALVLRAMPPLG